MEEDIKRDIVNYRRQKACDLMHDVDVLILHGIEVKSHMGVRQAFGLHFVKTNLLSSECGRIFSKIYDKRQSSDYDDFKEFTKDEIDNLYPQISFLISEVDRLITEK